MRIATSKIKLISQVIKTKREDKESSDD